MSVKSPQRQQVVLITGCSEGGIGDALAEEFHRRGLRVFATARSPSKVQSLADRCGEGLEVLALDVVDPESIRACVEELERRLGPGKGLDLLVNNSGVGYQMPLLDADLDEARRLFEVNVWGVLAVTQAFAPLLVAAVDAAGPGKKSNKVAGRVLNIGSVTSRMQVPWQGVYNSSKAAMGMISDTLRFEVAPLGIEVLHAVTGGVQTRFYTNTKGAELPAPKEGQPISLYEPARDVLAGDLAGGGARKHQTVTAQKYAQKVVGNALSNRPTKVMWIGGTSFLSYWGNRLGWATVTDWIIATFMWPQTAVLQKKLSEARKKSASAAA